MDLVLHPVLPQVRGVTLARLFASLMLQRALSTLILEKWSHTFDLWTMLPCCCCWADLITLLCNVEFKSGSDSLSLLLFFTHAQAHEHAAMTTETVEWAWESPSNLAGFNYCTISAPTGHAQYVFSQTRKPSIYAPLSSFRRNERSYASNTVSHSPTTDPWLLLFEKEIKEIYMK